MQERVKRISGAQYQTLMLVFITCTAIDLSEFVFLTRPLVQLPALSFSLRDVMSRQYRSHLNHLFDMRSEAFVPHHIFLPMFSGALQVNSSQSVPILSDSLISPPRK